MALSIAATAAIALSLVYLARPVQANTTPTYHEGNVNSCEDLGLPANTPGISIDASAVVYGSKTYDTVNGGSIVITANSTLMQFSFNSANPPVLVLAVKAGDGYNEYDYRPGGATADGGLATPMNNGGQQAALSHLYICFGEASESQPGSSEPADVGSIFIRKRNAESPYQHLAGAVFTVEGVEGTFTTDADGGACVTGLPQNTSLTVTEITPPDGFALPDPASQLVKVDNDGDCTSSDVIFKDEPVETSSEPATPSPEESVEAATPTPTPEESVKAATPTPTPEGSVKAATPTPTPEGSVKAATGSPQASTPNTAFGSDPSQPTGTLLFSLILILGVSTLAVVNVRTVRRQ